jgi:processive 1,2-diacylglycerol beta-glucosyltransferase
MESHLRRVSVLSAGVGAGHVRAGEAVVMGFQEALPGAKVVKQDVLEEAGSGFRALYRDAYVKLASSTPRLVGWLYDRADAPWQSRWYGAAVERLALRRWMRQILQDPPDIAVCTHFLPAALLCHLRRRHGLPSRMVTVVTDLDVHGLWLDGRADLWCVAVEEAREVMISAGVRPETVRVTGIPIHAEFGRLPSRAEARARLGLDPSRPLVLFSTGGCCLGPVERTFAQLLSLRDIANVVAICGHNQTALARLRALLPSRQNQQARLEGFTNDMPSWMAAADLLVGKPGGLTSSEARAAGLPLAAIHPIPGQEERNLAHLLEWGAAIACHTPATLAWRVRGLLTDPQRLARMSSAARASARPHATQAVVQAVIDMSGRAEAPFKMETARAASAA